MQNSEARGILVLSLFHFRRIWVTFK